MEVLTEQKKKEIMENGYYLLLIQNMEEVNTLMTALKVIDTIPTQDRPNTESLRKAILEIKNKIKEKRDMESSVMSNDSNCVGDVCEV